MDKLIAYSGGVCSGSCGNVDEGVVAWLFATFGVLFLLMIILAMLVLAFWVWMLVDASKRDEESYKKIGSGEKVLWIVILILSLLFQMTLVGSLIYFFLIYQKGKALELAKNKK